MQKNPFCWWSVVSAFFCWDCHSTNLIRYFAMRRFSITNQSFAVIRWAKCGFTRIANIDAAMMQKHMLDLSAQRHFPPSLKEFTAAGWQKEPRTVCCKVHRKSGRKLKWKQQALFWKTKHPLMQNVWFALGTNRKWQWLLTKNLLKETIWGSRWWMWKTLRKKDNHLSIFIHPLLQPRCHQGRCLQGGG